MQNNITITDKEEYISLLKDYDEIHDTLINYVPMTESVRSKLSSFKNKLHSLPSDVQIRLAKEKYSSTGECNHISTRNEYTGHDSHHDYYNVVCNICGKVIDKYKD